MSAKQLDSKKTIAMSAPDGGDGAVDIDLALSEGDQVNWPSATANSGDNLGQSQSGGVRVDWPAVSASGDNLGNSGASWPSPSKNANNLQASQPSMLGASGPSVLGESGGQASVLDASKASMLDTSFGMTMSPNAQSNVAANFS